jgi:hypothetical protein
MCIDYFNVRNADVLAAIVRPSSEHRADSEMTRDAMKRPVCVF